MIIGYLETVKGKVYFKIYESVPFTMDIELFAEVNEFWKNHIFDENQKKKENFNKKFLDLFNNFLFCFYCRINSFFSTIRY